MKSFLLTIAIIWGGSVLGLTLIVLLELRNEVARSLDPRRLRGLGPRVVCKVRGHTLLFDETKPLDEDQVAPCIRCGVACMRLVAEWMVERRRQDDQGIWSHGKRSSEQLVKHGCVVVLQSVEAEAELVVAR